MMNKRDLVYSAAAHEESAHIPYTVMLTGEGYNAYGQRLLDAFAGADIKDDLKEGTIDFREAVCLAIGNHMIQMPFPFWWFDMGPNPSVWQDSENAPAKMCPIGRSDTPEHLAAYEAHCKFVREKYGVFTMDLIYANHFEKANGLRGIENFLADMAAEPEYAQELLDFIVERNMEIIPKLINPYIDGILLGSDWGTQLDLLFSPTMWKEMIYPGQKRQFDFLKAQGKVRLLHSCGQISRILDGVCDLGVQILNPVQPECMDLDMLKTKWGEKLTFWGGVSTQRTLPYGTPAEVRKETESVIGILAKRGGYITSPSQEIQTDVPYENLVALIETARAYS
ncbi:MAG: hypothetical protein LBR73_06945 [Oscillospiraceae bacterium]|jgi:uroporphyrinogen decarboxylase|nr:hypothetical protein [Oscillospiraceae bacterium]